MGLALDRCMARMANWVHLSVSVVRSEFLGFELLQTFAVFNLSPALEEKDKADWANRLATFLNTDANNLARA